MHPYACEEFSDAEATVLRRYFTNLDAPVFALVNLPEVVKGALFARYSRSPKSLRRLFLDEFAGDLDMAGDTTVDATVGLARAEQLYERVFVEYGDDSVAQLGGVHLACEQASNILTKILEWGRLMSYLEQSTRYIAYDSRLANGHYRYRRDPAILDSPLGARYVGEMDRMFDSYAEMLPELTAYCARRYPRRSGDSELVWRQAVRAKALDGLRGLLPAGSLSNVGIYGTGQGYEQLLLRMRAHPLAEARAYADLMLTELRKVIPSFLARVDRPERGGAWIEYLAETRLDTEAAAAELLGAAALGTAAGAAAGAAAGTAAGTAPTVAAGGEEPPEVALVEFDPDGESKVLAAILFAHAALGTEALAARVREMGGEERARAFGAYAGRRTNRRHRPGRAYEATTYRFEVVSDYGAFRDLQRHRMLTIEWQPLGTGLGYRMPEIVAEAGLAPRFESVMERSAALHAALAGSFPVEAAYAVALAYRLRYSMAMNAREAMHLIELRSGPQGHPAYRRIAQRMHHAIADTAGHRLIAASMVYADHGETDLERLDAARAESARRSRDA